MILSAFREYDVAAARLYGRLGRRGPLRRRIHRPTLLAVAFHDELQQVYGGRHVAHIGR